MNHAPDPERADGEADVEGHLRMTEDQLQSGMTPSEAQASTRDEQRDEDV